MCQIRAAETSTSRLCRRTYLAAGCRPAGSNTIDGHADVASHAGNGRLRISQFSRWLGPIGTAKIDAGRLAHASRRSPNGSTMQPVTRNGPTSSLRFAAPQLSLWCAMLATGGQHLHNRRMPARPGRPLQHRRRVRRLGRQRRAGHRLGAVHGRRRPTGPRVLMITAEIAARLAHVRSRSRPAAGPQPTKIELTPSPKYRLLGAVPRQPAADSRTSTTRPGSASSSKSTKAKSPGTRRSS